jgi:hypothetical protein
MCGLKKRREIQEGGGRLSDVDGGLTSSYKPLPISRQVKCAVIQNMELPRRKVPSISILRGVGRRRVIAS